MDLKDELSNFADGYKDAPSDQEDPYAKHLKLKAQGASGAGAIGKAHPLSPGKKAHAHPLSPDGKKLATSKTAWAFWACDG